MRMKLFSAIYSPERFLKRGIYQPMRESPRNISNNENILGEYISQWESPWGIYLPIREPEDKWANERVPWKYIYQLESPRINEPMRESLGNISSDKRIYLLMKESLGIFHPIFPRGIKQPTRASLGNYFYLSNMGSHGRGGGGRISVAPSLCTPMAVDWFLHKQDFSLSYPYKS